MSGRPRLLAALAVVSVTAGGLALPPSASASTPPGVGAARTLLTEGTRPAGAPPGGLPADAGAGDAVPAPADPDLLDVDPTGPEIGTVAPPSRPLSGQTSRVLAAAPQSTLTLTFKVSGFRLAEVAPDLLPYAEARAARTDRLPHDAAGVRKFVHRGRTYDHPVLQAQWGLANVHSYLATRDRLYLDRAKANARQIIAARRVVTSAEGPAWFFAYPFDFHLHGGRAWVQRAPWYSAMAQGMAISLFTRLVSADPGSARQWRTAAHGAYRSFLVRPTATAPWVVHVDGSGYLWLDEYPVARRPGHSDLTYNGHHFAAFGLYDYHRLTASEGAARLYDGALTTAWGQLGNFRTRAWLSRYCLAHVVRDVKYHGIHVAQLRTLHRLSHAARFAQGSELLSDDYPSPQVSGVATLAAGTVTGYRFDSSGAVTARRVVRFPRSTGSTISSRVRIRTRGIYLQVSGGPLRGYAVAEAPDRVYLRGTTTLAFWSPRRTLAFRTDSQLLGRAAGSGVTPGAKAHFDRTVLIGARLWYRIADGALAGRYVRMGTVTTDVAM